MFAFINEIFLTFEVIEIKVPIPQLVESLIFFYLKRPFSVNNLAMKLFSKQGFIANL